MSEYISYEVFMLMLFLIFATGMGIVIKDMLYPKDERKPSVAAKRPKVKSKGKIRVRKG